MIRGFTLIETMVAISVLAVSLVGPFTAINNALVSSHISRDQLIASSLAQEGLEYIRSVRDNNYLNNRASWMYLINTYACYGSTPGQFCTVDPKEGMSSSAISACGSTVSGCPALRVSSSGFYNHTTGNTTPFKRVVKVRQVSATEVEVTVEVHWTTSRKSYSVTVTDVLRNWL